MILSLHINHLIKCLEKTTYQQVELSHQFCLLFAITMQHQSACFISPDKISQNTALADTQTVLLLHFKATFSQITRLMNVSVLKFIHWSVHFPFKWNSKYRRCRAKAQHEETRGRWSCDSQLHTKVFSWINSLLLFQWKATRGLAVIRMPFSWVYILFHTILKLLCFNPLFKQYSKTKKNRKVCLVSPINFQSPLHGDDNSVF